MKITRRDDFVINVLNHSLTLVVAVPLADETETTGSRRLSGPVRGLNYRARSWQVARGGSDGDGDGDEDTGDTLEDVKSVAGTVLIPEMTLASFSFYVEGCFGEGRKEVPPGPAVYFGGAHSRLELALLGLKQPPPPWKEQHRRQTGRLPEPRQLPGAAPLRPAGAAHDAQDSEQDSVAGGAVGCLEQTGLVLETGWKAGGSSMGGDGRSGTFAGMCIKVNLCVLSTVGQPGFTDITGATPISERSLVSPVAIFGTYFTVFFAALCS
ncbi:hypothetical protein CB1_000849058 [Camelus ferus]|nr:hypothetical protein CB1_000849058 [Camelus ferus]